MPRPPVALLVAAIALAAFDPHAARGDSQLQLAYPEAFGTVPAATYDTSRHRVGDAHLVLEKLENEGIRIFAESGFDGGTRNVATALFEANAVGHSLAPVLQESKTFLGDGSLRSTLLIDHRAGTATCGKASAGGLAVEQIALPAADRVANVALTLLFMPLVQGEAERLSFQLLLCEGGARLLDFEARVERRDVGANGSGSLVEIRYRPDLGPIGSFVAEHLIPRLSFWFDPNAANPWLAHRLPLFTKGPEVLVVRDGVSTRWLAGDR